MIDDKKFAESQVKRLAQMAGYPREREALRELCFAVMKFDTQEAAAAWIGEWIASENVCPLPKAINLAAYEFNQRNNTSWIEAKKCPYCSGSGFLRSERVMQAFPGMARSQYDFAVPCDHSGSWRNENRVAGS
jgi:hypothetical protein